MDFCIDGYYELMASDFLSDEEIAEAAAQRELTEDDAHFWFCDLWA